MQISEAKEFRALLIKRIAEREFAERTGVHCSDLIYCLNKQALRRQLGEEPSEQDILIFSLGWATQRWLTGKTKDEDAIEKDGILVTCDSLTPLVGTTYNSIVPWELKCTFQSSNKPVDENTHWLRQIMAQCYVTGSLEAYLSRFELMGNWKSIFGKKGEKELPENGRPTLHAFHLEFSQAELEKNWQWLCGRRDLFLALLNGGALLPKVVAIPSGQDYECGWCKFAGKECNV